MVLPHKALVWTLALASAAMAGCSSGPPGSIDDGTTESVGIDLKIGRTTQIKQVRYTVTGPSGFSASGSFDVPAIEKPEARSPTSRPAHRTRSR